MAEGPEGARAFWARSSDGVRVRIGYWPTGLAPQGTVLLFPGRTEYLEKYGRVTSELTAAGYHVLGIDWRGQGLSDRLTEDSRLGHVLSFDDYQLDVRSLLAKAEELELPKPFYLLAHSMGGCIGLRALVEGLEVNCAVFSAPMWGIFVSRGAGPVAKFLPSIMKASGQGLRTLPSTSPTSHITGTTFMLNLLTNDRDHYDYMRRQAEAHPEFALGGPTYFWFSAARREMASLINAPRVNLPVQTYLGTREAIVDPRAIREMHENWPAAELTIVSGARHELMMEIPELRSQFMTGALEFFKQNR